MQKFVALALVLLISHGCDSGSSSEPPEIVGEGRYLLEAWADNWFAVYAGDRKIGEDSVPITTERSFNAERIAFDSELPLTLSFILKDFKEDDSGLEYIGSDKQQMGDGGFVMQVTDTDTGNIVLTSSSYMRCLVIHKAPLNKDCERSADPLTSCMSQISDEPEGWKIADYDAQFGEAATEYTTSQVGAKDGYDQIAWDAAAKPIWTSDLESDNTLLCKITIL